MNILIWSCLCFDLVEESVVIDDNAMDGESKPTKVYQFAWQNQDDEEGTVR